MKRIMASILGMGNPLLDISATVDTAMLDKYSLKANDAILYEKEDLFEELIANHKVDYFAGGATQNSCRVAQWLLPEAKSVAFFGCVGTDKSCEILETVSSEAGMVVKYQKSTEHPTGKCAVLITGENRSLVTKLDAANHFTPAHLDEKDNWALVEAAKVFYSSGFFLTVSPDSMLKVAEHAGASEGKRFAINLSAPFLCQFFKDPMLKVILN
jgi:adenosine kinase